MIGPTSKLPKRIIKKIYSRIKYDNTHLKLLPLDLMFFFLIFSPLK